MLWLPPYPSPTFFHKLFELFQQLKRKRGQVLEMLQHVSSVIKKSRTFETWVQNWPCLGCFCRQNDAELKISAISISATLPNVVCYEIGWNTVPKQVDPSNAPLQVISAYGGGNSRFVPEILQWGKNRLQWKWLQQNGPCDSITNPCPSQN